MAEENGDLMLDTGAFRLKVPEDKAALVRQHGGREFLFGIRPEDINQADPTDNNAISMTAEIIEPLGDRTDVYLSAESGEKIIARLKPQSAPQPSEKICIKLNNDKIHLFETGLFGNNIG